MRRRTISRSLRDDRNSTFQLDFIGRDIFTGPVKHTFQLGFDYKKHRSVDHQLYPCQHRHYQRTGPEHLECATCCG